MTCIRSGLSIAAMAIVACASSSICMGQARTDGERLWAGVTLGPTSYDLAGTGTGLVINAALFWQPLKGILISPSLPFFHYDAQFERPTSYLFPEVSFITSPFAGPLQPYFGVGAGWAVLLSGTGESDPTLHGLSGLRLRLSRAFAVRCEIKARAVDPFIGTTADVTCGADIGLVFKHF